MRRTALATGILLALAVPAAGRSVPDSSWSAPARYEFEYRVAIEGAPSGRIAIWIPYPSDTAAQKVLDASVESPWPWKLTTEKRFGNRMAYLEGDGPPPGEIVLRFRVERRPFRGIPAGDAARDGFLDPDRYLKSDRLIPLEGKIRELAEQEGKGHSSPSGKVRAFYDYVVRTMTYRKDGTGWGRGDAVWACTSRYGNCTDFHSLFIGMVRSARIPARFVIGFPIPAGRPEGEVAGYHCWAEFFDPAKGWRGVDASEAWKTRRADDYFGTLPNDRIEFTIGRDLILEPPQRSEALNYFIYPYVEVDGKPHEGVTRLFHFRRLDAPTG